MRHALSLGYGGENATETMDHERLLQEATQKGWENTDKTVLSPLRVGWCLFCEEHVVTPTRKECVADGHGTMWGKTANEYEPNICAAVMTSVPPALMCNCGSQGKHACF